MVELYRNGERDNFQNGQNNSDNSRANGSTGNIGNDRRVDNRNGHNFPNSSGKNGDRAFLRSILIKE